MFARPPPSPPPSSPSIGPASLSFSAHYNVFDRAICTCIISKCSALLISAYSPHRQCFAFDLLMCCAHIVRARRSHGCSAFTESVQLAGHWLLAVWCARCVPCNASESMYPHANLPRIIKTLQPIVLESGSIEALLFTVSEPCPLLMYEARWLANMHTLKHTHTRSYATKRACPNSQYNMLYSSQ